MLAHEFGHAVQGRVGFSQDGGSILDETQADCFAGAWTAWVIGGHARHVAIRLPQLDDVLRGYLGLSDPVGTGPNNGQAHGSFFDRVSAFSDGYDRGVTTCRDDFAADRLFTAAVVQRRDAPSKAMRPTPTPSTLVDRRCRLLDRRVPAVVRQDVRASRRHPVHRLGAVASLGSATRELGWCAGGHDRLLRREGPDRPAYDKIGDWAVATAISLPYALAARGEPGRSTDDAAATRRRSA